MKADRVIGLVIIMAGLGLALATAQIGILASQPTLSARFFPYLLSGVLLAGGGVLVLRPGETALPDVVNRLLAGRAVAFAALFLIYALTFRHVDFRLGSWAFVLAAMWVLGSRRWLELLITPLCVSAAAYLLFRYGFTVLLPVWT